MPWELVDAECAWLDDSTSQAERLVLNRVLPNLSQLFSKKDSVISDGKFSESVLSTLKFAGFGRAHINQAAARSLVGAI